jgi:5,5'-dehydrodivanillate O-demethylase
MLTKEENELLTHVGPGTPCGELLRRYWQPVGFAADLTPERPTKRVKVMHEELVLFRMPDGTYGCLGEHCAHRGASLAYGFVEECGLRCPYHGWKYDAQGHCLEQPFEPAGSTYKDRVRQKAYPVEQLAGMLFVYMGPQPAPLLPRWDLLVWTDGRRKLMRQEVLDCNWLQIQENTADVTHLYFLHAHMMYTRGVWDRGVERLYRPFERYGFQPFEWGLLKSWRYAPGITLPAEKAAGQPLVFPNILRSNEYPWHAMHWRVPIDDTHTEVYWAGFLPGEPYASTEELESPPIDEHPPQKPGGEYDLDSFFGQDRMAWETQGDIMNRSSEHLGASDRGIVMYRQMLREQIERVRQGLEPMALVRDPAQNAIINLPAWLIDTQEMGLSTEEFCARVGMQKVGQPMSEYFDDRQEWFEVAGDAARGLETHAPPASSRGSSRWDV